MAQRGFSVDTPVMQTAPRTPAYLDILFAARNKVYDAYEQRIRYARRLRKAAAGVLFSAVVLVAWPLLVAAVGQRAVTAVIPPRFDTTILSEILQEEIRPATLQPKTGDAPPVATDAFATPRVVHNESAKEEDALQQPDTAHAIGAVDAAGPGSFTLDD